MVRREFLKTTFSALNGLLSIRLFQLFPQEFFYYAWNWEKWRKITGAHPEKFSSDQVGKSELVDLLQRNGHKITTVEEWVAKREEIKKLLLQIMGEFPVITTWLNPRILEEKE
ncbi:MAG: hypothetical protein D6813_07785, partial [Calditrichaeota bacterium]